MVKLRMLVDLDIEFQDGMTEDEKGELYNEIYENIEKSGRSPGQKYRIVDGCIQESIEY